MCIFDIVQDLTSYNANDKIWNCTYEYILAFLPRTKYRGNLERLDSTRSLVMWCRSLSGLASSKVLSAVAQLETSFTISRVNVCK